MTSEELLAELNQDIVVCRLCPRLVEWREKIAQERRRAYRDWSTGASQCQVLVIRTRLLIVGLAPGAHGANRTGRCSPEMAPEFPFPCPIPGRLRQPADCNQSEDGLRLKDVYITAVCRCAPPTTSRPGRNFCLPAVLKPQHRYLMRLEGMVALGRIAFDHTLRIIAATGRTHPKTGISPTGLSTTWGGSSRGCGILPIPAARTRKPDGLPQRCLTRSGTVARDLLSENGCA